MTGSSRPATDWAAWFTDYLSARASQSDLPQHCFDALELFCARALAGSPLRHEIEATDLAAETFVELDERRTKWPPHKIAQLTSNGGYAYTTVENGCKNAKARLESEESRAYRLAVEALQKQLGRRDGHEILLTGNLSRKEKQARRFRTWCHVDGNAQAPLAGDQTAEEAMRRITNPAWEPWPVLLALLKELGVPIVEEKAIKLVLAVTIEHRRMLLDEDACIEDMPDAKSGHAVEVEITEQDVSALLSQMTEDERRWLATSYELHQADGEARAKGKEIARIMGISEPKASLIKKGFEERFNQHCARRGMMDEGERAALLQRVAVKANIVKT